MRARGDGQRNAGGGLADFPFVDYLDPSDALWCDPAEVLVDRSSDAPIAAPGRCKLVSRARPGRRPQFGRRAVAERHLPVYHRLRESVYA